MIKRCVVIATLGLAACGGGSGRQEPPPQQPPPPPPNLQARVAQSIALSCAPDRSPKAFARIAENVVGPVWVSPCGDILYAASTNGIRLRRRDGTDTVLATLPAQALAHAQEQYSKFDLTGRYASYLSTTGLVIEDLIAGTRQSLTFTGGIRGFGFAWDEARSKSLPYLLDANGLRVIEDGVEYAIPDAGPGSPLVVSKRGVVVALGDWAAGQLRLVNLATRATTVVTVLASPSSELSMRADPIYLSPDGRTVVHQPVKLEPSSDSFEPKARGPFQVRRTDTGEVLFESPNPERLLTSGSFSRPGLYFSDTGHALALGTVLVTSNQPGIVLIDTNSFQVSTRAETFFSFSDNGEAILSERAADGTHVRVMDPAGGGVHAGFDADGTRSLATILRAPAEVPHFIVSPDGKAVAFTRYQRSVKNADGSSVAHVLDVLVQREGAAAQTVSTALQFYPLGIGACGDVLFAGAFVEGEIPLTAPTPTDFAFKAESYFWKGCNDAPGAFLPSSFQSIEQAQEHSSSLLAVRVIPGPNGTVRNQTVFTLDRATGAVTERVTHATALLPSQKEILTVTANEGANSVLYSGKP